MSWEIFIFLKIIMSLFFLFVVKLRIVLVQLIGYSGQRYHWGLHYHVNFRNVQDVYTKIDRASGFSHLFVFNYLTCQDKVIPSSFI